MQEYYKGNYTCPRGYAFKQWIKNYIKTQFEDNGCENANIAFVSFAYDYSTIVKLLTDKGMAVKEGSVDKNT